MNTHLHFILFFFKKLTYNPEGIVFDLPGEALVLINPPVDAILAGVVWKYSLSWPHLRGRELVTVYEQASFNSFGMNLLRTLVWYPFVNFPANSIQFTLNFSQDFIQNSLILKILFQFLKHYKTSMSLTRQESIAYTVLCMQTT